jgi:hypothetical protein
MKSAKIRGFWRDLAGGGAKGARIKNESLILKDEKRRRIPI